MGADISKPNALDTAFTQKSNEILEELEKFFRPLEEFEWVDKDEKSFDPKMKVDALDKYIDENGDINMKRLKEERYVCNQLVFIYQKELLKLIGDENLKKGINDFAEKRGIYLRDWKFDKNMQNICDQIIDYYTKKYKVYRIINSLIYENNSKKFVDPFMEDYLSLSESIKKDKSGKNFINAKLKNFNEQIGKDSVKLGEAREDFLKEIKNIILEPLQQDKLTKNELENILANFSVKENKLNQSFQNYCKDIYTAKSRIRDQSYNQVDTNICNQLTLNDYMNQKKKLKISHYPQTNKDNKKRLLDDDDALELKDGLPVIKNDVIPGQENLYEEEIKFLNNLIQKLDINLKDKDNEKENSKKLIWVLRWIGVQCPFDNNQECLKRLNFLIKNKNDIIYEDLKNDQTINSIKFRLSRKKPGQLYIFKSENGGNKKGKLIEIDQIPSSNVSNVENLITPSTPSLASR